MNKFFLTSVICSALLSASYMPSAQAKENINGPMFGESRSALYNEVVVRKLAGNVFDKDYADKMVSSFTKEYITATVNAELASMQKTISDFTTFKEKAANQLPVLKGFDPEMHAYVVRLAELLTVDIEDLWVSFYADAAWVESMQPKLIYAWNHNGELKNKIFSEMFKGRGGCTTAAWSNGIVGGNEDFASIYGGTGELIVSDNLLFEGSYNGAWRAQSRHIGMVVNTLVSDSLADGANGLPQPIIIASVVKRAKNVPDAIKMLDSVRGESPFNYTMADTEGNAAAYNMLKKPLKVTVLPVNGAVTHTNHRTSSRKSILRAWGDDYQQANSHFGYSIARRDTANTLTRIVPHDERTAGTMKTILRTQPILMRAARGEDFGTIYSFVMDVPQGCIYMTPDRPDLTDYKKVCF
ncbi:carcinine hydrolase/isopenicillin-N N-acyltransferase family protein [Photobacterium kagoshimensis]|uniref:carcinine hydrolase/isopenicillin-N N-acyltransferase family protein n=1 Tax=Photobacterium kagoshimensis TaxID=2910242 RepID=UPI003D11A159